jgi:serine/threonine protein kinase/tetratricopeptide (TPR) repeat protein
MAAALSCSVCGYTPVPRPAVGVGESGETRLATGLLSLEDGGETRLGAPLPAQATGGETRLATDLPLDGGETRLGAPLPTQATGGETRLATDLPLDGGETRLATPLPSQGTGDNRTQPPRSKTGGVLTTGQSFGSRYHIIRELGVGGMGAVYQAWDAELGVAVAIKVIRPDAIADPKVGAELERRFKRELLLARQVTHKNVVRIHDLGEIDGIKYITMSYVEGGDLASFLRSHGRLPVPQVIKIARDVVAGLVEAHKAGVVHRDLKPANIMLAKDGDALIMDFGIASSSGAPPPLMDSAILPAALRHTAISAEATRLGTVVGTVQYMAPEQARGQEVDQRADIYALGLIFYDMLAGQAYRGDYTDGAVAELQSRMEQAPRALKGAVPDVPEAFDQLITRCLQPDPAMRYQTTEELAAELNRLDDNGVPIPELRRFTPRMIAAGVVLVALLVAGTWWMTRTPPPPPPHDPVSVLIADFQNTTGDPTFDQALVQSARRGLEGASFISAYDHSRLRGVFNVPPPAKLDAAAAREYALKQGVLVVLAGSIAPKDGGYQIDATATQTVTGGTITKASRFASNKNEVLDATAKVTAAVRKALGDKTSESAQLFAMRSITASSVDVVGYYAQAVEAQAQGKFEDARQSYLKAVSLDPKFGLGYQGLAATSRNLGRMDDADKYIKEALHYLDSMTDRERLATRGLYDRQIGDNAQCAKEYGELLARYPADAIAHNQRGACLAKLRNFRAATDEIRQASRLVPNHVGIKANVALMSALSGDFEGAEQQLKSLPEMTPAAVQFLAYSQIARADVAGASDSYTKLGAMGPTYASTAASGLGDVALYQGQFSEAVRILEKGAADDLAAKNADRAATKLTSVAYANLLMGRTQPAIAAAEKALSLTKSMSPRFLAARMLIEAGAIDEARPVAASLSAQLPAEPHAHGRILEGLIALKSGKIRDAVAILGDANSVLDTWFGHFDLGRAYLEGGALPQADSEFDLCIKRRGEALSLMDDGPTYGYFPSVYYYQGKVREGLNTASFADAYRHYLDIRGDSKDDPLVRDLRKRVSQ